MPPGRLVLLLGLLVIFAAATTAAGADAPAPPL